MSVGRSTRKGGCAIAVMAKAPRAGQVKTRLVPPLTPEVASALSASFLRDMTDNIVIAARDSGICCYVAYAPAGYEALFGDNVAAGTRFIVADGAGVTAPAVLGFGRCLFDAVQSLFALEHEAVCLLNSDSPTLPTSLLVDAAAALAEEGDRVVLGPADDGGYYLIGMKAAHMHLFEDIAWSTDMVAEQTRTRVRSLGLPLVELLSWYDVDDATSLYRLRRELESECPVSGLRPYSAPFTARCIERLRVHGSLGDNR
jgi:uncharacterized protein